MAKVKSADFPSSASRCANGCSASPPTPRNCLHDLDTIDWSDSLKEMQRNWIGRSEGAEVDFRFEVQSSDAENFDRSFYHATRHFVWRDLHGARARTHTALTKSRRPNNAKRFEVTKPKLRKNPTSNALNWRRKRPACSPALTPSIPSTVRRFPSGLPITFSPATAPAPSWPCRRMTNAILSSRKNSICRFSCRVVRADRDWPKTGLASDFVGSTVSSLGRHSNQGRKFPSPDLPTAEAKKKITAWLEEKGLGKKTINYKLRDWLFSRQRYWGEPFPIVWKKDAAGNLYHEALPETALPVLPPTLEDYKPTADRRTAARPRERLGESARWLDCARRTRCRNGPVRAGIICVFSTRKIPTRLSARKRKSIGWVPRELRNPRLRDPQIHARC